MKIITPSQLLSPLAIAISGSASTVQAVIAESRFDLEEVVVTAQKRSQSLQDVPISISAYDGEALKAQGLSDVRSLISSTPGLSGSATDSFLSDVSVRGISSNDYGLGGDLSLGVFRNGVHAGRNGEVINSFFDIERVEVLKGPQGLLFGRSASSGAFHIITNKPQLDESVSGSIGIGGGQRGQKRGDATLNLPVSDTLALRMAAYHSEEEGYVRNTLGGEKLGGFDNTAFRFSALHSSDEIDVTFIIEHEDSEQSSTIYTLLDPATRKPIEGLGHRSTSSDIGAEATNESDVLNMSLQVNYETDSGIFTSISGARKHEFDYRENVDGIGLPVLDFTQNQEGDYFSQEFRFVSNAASEFRWFVGLSAFKDQVEADFSLISPAFFGARDLGRGESDTKGYAIYGDATYDISERFRASVGVRYSYDNREYSAEASAAELGALLPFTTPNGSVRSEESWTSLTPRLLLEYDISEDSMVYASFSKGFKPGGFDSYGITNSLAGVATADSEVVSFDQEEILSYELGAKGDLFNDRGNYALAAYYYDYKDLQQQIPNPSGVGVIVTNVGKAEGMGLEAEFTLKLSENVRLISNAAWSDTEVKEISPNACSGTTLCKGKRLPGSSKLMASAKLLVNFSIAEMDSFASMELVYNDGFPTDLQNQAAILVDSWKEVNLRAGIYINDAWRLSAYLENASDEEYFTAYSDLSLAGIPGLGINGDTASRPRTFGFDVSYRY